MDPSISDMSIQNYAQRQLEAGHNNGGNSIPLPTSAEIMRRSLDQFGTAI